MGCNCSKWLCYLACITVLAASSRTVDAQVFSRKFNKNLMELLQAMEHVEADTDALRNTSDPNLVDAEVAGLTNLERQEIGDANPMCHIITFEKRLQSLSNVSANCMRDTVFDDCCQPIFVALRTSGIYPIKHGRKGYAYCDMERDGGGWLVVARRAGGKRNFNKTWRRYKKGFGPLDKDFWIGLDAMHLLTYPSLDTELRFDMRHENGSWYHAYYNQIIVGPESDNYTLTVRGYDPERSTIYDAMSTLNGHPFSTKDNVNVDFQPAGSSCPGLLNRSGAGWWWRPVGHCYRVNMNNEYHIVYNSKGDTFPRGIGWCDVKTTACRTAFQFIEMKVRPRQWRCGNQPRIAWETVQYQFLYREEEEEEDEGGENETEMPTSNTTTATPTSTLSEPVPDTENKHVAPTDSAEERGSGMGNKEQLDMVSPVTEPVDQDKATTTPTTSTPGTEEGNTPGPGPGPAASTMTPPTPIP